MHKNGSTWRHDNIFYYNLILSTLFAVWYSKMSTEIGWIEHFQMFSVHLFNFLMLFSLRCEQRHLATRKKSPFNLIHSQFCHPIWSFSGNLFGMKNCLETSLRWSEEIFDTQRIKTYALLFVETRWLELLHCNPSSCSYVVYKFIRILSYKMLNAMQCYVKWMAWC